MQKSENAAERPTATGCTLTVGAPPALPAYPRASPCQYLQLLPNARYRRRATSFLSRWGWGGPFSGFTAVSLLSCVQVSTLHYSRSCLKYHTCGSPPHRPLRVPTPRLHRAARSCWAELHASLDTSLGCSQNPCKQRLSISLSFTTVLHPQQNLRINKAVWLSSWGAITFFTEPQDLEPVRRAEL